MSAHRRAGRAGRIYANGVISMTGAERVQDVAVVFAALVGVFDEQADRRASGFAFVNTAQNFDCIGLVALRHKLGGARAASVQVGLDIRF